MGGSIILLVIVLLAALPVGYLIYIDVVVSMGYQAQKDKARKKTIRKAKIGETKRRNRYRKRGV
jgi:hypothetical protein